jgi:hypothetical protein
MAARYPLFIDDQRSLPDDYSGNVFVWDVDKTYLSTHFSSMRGILRIPIEMAVDKRAIPGMPEVLRGLRHGPGERYAAVPLYFLSASPKELRKVLERKMLLDGVEYDGLILKDWTRAILGGRPGRLKEQVGFKLCALLTAWRSRTTAVEYLFGDDTEQDAEAFHLYAQMLAGELRGEQADRAMALAAVATDDRACVHALLRTLPATHGSVGRAFIHLERGTPPSFFSKFGGLVVPVKGAPRASPWRRRRRARSTARRSIATASCRRPASAGSSQPRSSKKSPGESLSGSGRSRHPGRPG